MISVVLPGPAPAPERIRPLKRREYERLGAEGAFDHERVELLDGWIVRSSPMGGPHSYAVDHLNELLAVGLVGRARVRCQSPFAASDTSEPEPDMAVVPLGDYLDFPPDRAHLIVEVAQSSLHDDRRKAALYGAAAVPEYWLVNVVDEVIEVHTGPCPAGYARVERFERGAVLRVPSFEDVEVPVDRVLPPRS